jgi:uncharacterized protein (UPF0371 family)
MQNLEDRIVVRHAREAALEAEKKGKGNEGIFCGAAIELPNGTIITGKNSPLMHAASALVLNAVKYLANIPDTMHLLPPNIMESISHFKKDVLKGKRVSLDLEETLIALSISATMTTSTIATIRLTQIKEHFIYSTGICNLCLEGHPVLYSFIRLGSNNSNIRRGGICYANRDSCFRRIALTIVDLVLEAVGTNVARRGRIASCPSLYL